MQRREFLRELGVSSAAASFLLGLPSLLQAGTGSAMRRKRLVFVFSPNGVIPKHFWPDQTGADYDVKRILEPLAPFQSQMLTAKGICNKIKGDGDGHMRGIGCLLTGIELFPGDIQGGSDTPAGWSMGISVDQHIKNRLQADAATQTRFGSLEFGVMVPDRADTWTRMSYGGPNQPMAPISDPYQMFDKLYGQVKNRQMLASVLDDLAGEFKSVSRSLSSEDRKLLNLHLELVRDVEKDLQTEFAAATKNDTPSHAVPKLAPNIEEQNDNMPEITKMQTELLVNSFLADFARVATFQITNSVGQPRMRWLDINEGHHGLSHEPDSNEDAYEKLIRINTWYAEQVAHMAQRMRDTPDPSGHGSLLDNTTIVWTNELGKGNSHTRNDIPFVMIGGGLDFEMGRALDFGSVTHNRLLLSFLEGFGMPEETFGNPDFCKGGALSELMA
ncbi:MAG: DUF1552 domain-containing protein [Planctomycetota bacterium]